MIRHVAQKHILGGLGVVLALLGALVLTRASPSALTTSTVVIGSDSVLPGESATVSLQALDIPGGGGSLGAVTVDVVYDPDVVNITNCDPDPGNLLAFSICNTSLALNTVRVTGIDDEGGVSGDLLLADLTFQAIGAAGEVSPLVVLIVTFADTNGLDIPVSGQNGSIEILAPTPTPTPTPCSDGDGDGWCDSSEIYLGTDPNLRCAATPGLDDEGPPDAWPVDFNDDRRANMQDVIFAFVTTLAPNGLNQPASGPLVRVDFNGNGFINMQDVILGYVTRLQPTGLNTTCTP